MLCMDCGKEIGEKAGLCEECLSKRPAELQPAETAADQAVQLPAAGHYGDAGFWYRLVAYLIDHSLVSIISTLVFIGLIVLGLAGGGVMILGLGGNEELMKKGFIAGLFVMLLTTLGAFIVVGWLYYALMESSRYRGTVGKIAMGLAVTDLNDQPVSFMRASGRYFGRIVSALIFCIGYIMAGFTKRKQALHDKIAGCYVVKAEEISSSRLAACIITALILIVATKSNLQSRSTDTSSMSSQTASLSQPTTTTVTPVSGAAADPAVSGGGNVVGTFKGARFQARKVVYSTKTNVLEFSSDDSFFPEKSVKLFLLKANYAEAGKFVRVDKDSSGLAPHVHVGHKTSERLVPSTEIYSSSSEYTMNLYFIEVNDTKVRGVIFLTLPKEDLEISGNFTAARE